MCGLPGETSGWDLMTADVPSESEDRDPPGEGIAGGVPPHSPQEGALMDKAGGQEDVGPSRGASGCQAGPGRGAPGRRAGPGCIGCAKEGGGVQPAVGSGGGQGVEGGSGGPWPHLLRSRSVGGIRADPHGFGDCFGNQVDTTSHWLESVMGRGVSWAKQRGECGGWGALGTETLRSADSGGQLR